MCVCMCVCVRACVGACVRVLHNEKVTGEWQARQVPQAVLQVSSSKHNAKKLQQQQEAHPHRKKEGNFLNLHILQSTCFRT